MLAAAFVTKLVKYRFSSRHSIYSTPLMNVFFGIAYPTKGRQTHNPKRYESCVTTAAAGCHRQGTVLIVFKWKKTLVCPGDGAPRVFPIFVP